MVLQAVLLKPAALMGSSLGPRRGCAWSRDGGGGGEGKKKFKCLKWASQFWISIQSFIFPPRGLLGCGLGGWTTPYARG